MERIFQCNRKAIFLCVAFLLMLKIYKNNRQKHKIGYSELKENYVFEEWKGSIERFDEGNETPNRR